MPRRVIDTAHVLDYADWTTYLGSRLFGQLASGATIQLSDEAGKRRVVLEKIDPEFLRAHDPLAPTAFAGGDRSEILYERSADAWVRAVLTALGPISKGTAIEAMQNLDGV